MKSSPELWAECSDAASLTRHLGQFGEIRITKLEPETAVAWEGSAASGTVKLEPSGWGTRVTLTVTSDDTSAAEPMQPAEPAEPVQPVKLVPEPPVADAEPPPQPAGLARLLALFRRRPVPEPPAPAPEPTPEPPKTEPPKAQRPSEVALTAALESLGQAHHRPYSRA